MPSVLKASCRRLIARLCGGELCPSHSFAQYFEFAVSPFKRTILIGRLGIHRICQFARRIFDHETRPILTVAQKYPTRSVYWANEDKANDRCLLSLMLDGADALVSRLKCDDKLMASPLCNRLLATRPSVKLTSMRMRRQRYARTFLTDRWLPCLHIAASQP